MNRWNARVHLESLVGNTIETLTGQPNTVLRVEGDTVFVGTQKSPAGQPVPIQWVQDAMDQLADAGELAIEVETVGNRSAFHRRCAPDSSGRGSGRRNPTSQGRSLEIARQRRIAGGLKDSVDIRSHLSG
jgi:hypothetical protein